MDQAEDDENQARDAEHERIELDPRCVTHPRQNTRQLAFESVEHQAPRTEDRTQTNKAIVKTREVLNRATSIETGVRIGDEPNRSRDGGSTDSGTLSSLPTQPTSAMQSRHQPKTSSPSGVRPTVAGKAILPHRVQRNGESNGSLVIAGSLNEFIPPPSSDHSILARPALASN